jgi:hypothetical protein
MNAQDVSNVVIANASSFFAASTVKAMC